MTVLWLLMLIVWGIVKGFSAIPLVAWLLLIPFAWRAAGRDLSWKE